MDFREAVAMAQDRGRMTVPLPNPLSIDQTGHDRGPTTILISGREAREISRRYGTLTLANWCRYHGVEP